MVTITLENKNQKLITIDEKKLKLIGVVLAMLVIVGCAIYIVKMGNNNIKLAKEVGYLNGTQIGYQQALLDIAYTVATKGEVSYIVPTTNITLTLVQKK